MDVIEQKQKKHLKGWQLALVGVVLWIFGKALGGVIGALVLLTGAVFVLYGALTGIYNLIKGRKQ